MRLKYINKNIIPDIPNDELKVTIINAKWYRFCKSPKIITFLSSDDPRISHKKWTTLDYKPVSKKTSDTLNIWDGMCI